MTYRYQVEFTELKLSRVIVEADSIDDAMYFAVTGDHELLEEKDLPTKINKVEKMGVKAQ